MKLDSLASIRLTNQSVRIMCDVLDEEGIDWLPLAAEAGIDPAVVEDPQGRISGLNEFNFQQAFAQATRAIPDLWFRTGLRYRATSFGPLGLLTLAAETVETALHRVSGSLQDLTYSLANYQLFYEAGELRGMEADSSALPDGFREFSQQRDLAAATMLLHDLLQHPFPLEYIESNLERPRNWSEWEDHLQVRVIFNAQATRWLFQPGAGALRLPMASQMLEAAYSRLCMEIVEQARAVDNFVQRVSSLLLRQETGVHSAAEVARLLAMSERTLHRKLAQRELSFGKLVDQTREKRARELLKSSQLPIDRISETLGFAETASFSRAFKRWTGLPPLQFRKRNAA
ncbi:MAG: AraC family transcriptional regulator ligand-binding domain-containing protein [Nevskia sp.]|nr:AraC family transcriptional regulator ligand-binding domain-containing protein [Nevskia sp.]